MIIRHSQDVKPSTYSGAPEGVELRNLITAEEGAPNFAMRLFHLVPGASTPFHYHGWEHEVFVLEGRGRIRQEGGETPFRAGDAVYIPPDERHCFIADAGAAVRFLCVIPAEDRCRL